MATKRDPIFIKYEKLAAAVRKNVKDFTDYNYTVPITHIEIKARFQLVKEYITEMNKILDMIKKGQGETTEIVKIGGFNVRKPKQKK
jgi:ribosomal protein S18